MKKSAKYIVITGGVVSSLGKGVAAASIGALLLNKGYKVKIRKMDPYLNVDPGTLNPYEHGEVFVTCDGGETDLDLGHYERFTGCRTSKEDSTTSGKIYSDVLNEERRGNYEGKTVQVVPHITDAIKKFITHNEEGYDFIICEVGGTVGDIEGMPFLEAIRQLKNGLYPKQVLNIHLTLLPYVASAEEFKTKPTQSSVKELLSIGIQADFIMCRTIGPIPIAVKEKIAHFCNVRAKHVFEAVDTDCIYRIPILFKENNLDEEILQFFGLVETQDKNLEGFRDYISKYESLNRKVTIGIFGKYTKLKDSYKSLYESLISSGVCLGAKVNIQWINTDVLSANDFKGLDGIIVPGGFGARGTEEKINTIQYARENNIPFLGICFGMQLMAIEFARNVLGISDASTAEIVPDAANLIIVPNSNVDQSGPVMCLEEVKCYITPGTRVSSIYGQSEIKERVRHRYRFNNDYLEKFAKAGMISSVKTEQNVVYSLELKEHKWFVGVQYHPEFNSTPLRPNVLIKNFIKATLNN